MTNKNFLIRFALALLPCSVIAGPVTLMVDQTTGKLQSPLAFSNNIQSIAQATANTTSNALESQFTGGATATVVTNVGNSIAGVVGTNGNPLTFLFSSTGTNNIQSIAQPLVNTTSNTLAGYASSQATAATNALITSATGGNSPLVATNQLIPVSATAVPATNQYAFFNGDNGKTNIGSTIDGRYLTNLVSWTHEGTTTNITAAFNGTLQTLTVTNGPTVFFHYLGANGSISYRIYSTNFTTLAFDFQPKWLAGSNNVITNGVLSLTSYGGTNVTTPAQLEAAIKENQ